MAIFKNITKLRLKAASSQPSARIDYASRHQSFADVLCSFRDIFDHLECYSPFPPPFADLCTTLARALAEGADRFGSPTWISPHENTIDQLISSIGDPTLLNLWQAKTPINVAEMLRHASSLALVSMQSQTCRENKT